MSDDARRLRAMPEVDPHHHPRDLSMGKHPWLVPPDAIDKICDGFYARAQRCTGAGQRATLHDTAARVYRL